LLVATGPADVDRPEAITRFVQVAVLGFEVVLLSRLVERRRVGLEVGTAFFR
jgi:hypothetical protein